MNGKFLTDIMDQAEAAAQTYTVLFAEMPELIPQDPFERLIFVGSGDSYFAGVALQYAARQVQPRTVYATMSNEAAKYWQFTSQDLVIPISISGESKKTVEAATKALSNDAKVLPITNRSASTLAQTAEKSIVIPFQSVSRRTPHSTDYMTTLIAIATLLEAISHQPISVLGDISQLVDSVLKSLDKYSDLFALAKGRKAFSVVGGGPNYGTAQYGAAKFWEAGGSKASPFEVEEVGHGPYMTFRTNELVVLVMPEGRSFKRAQSVLKGIQTLGFETLVITNSKQEIPGNRTIHIPEIDELWSPVLAAIPLQYLCYSFSNFQGIDTDNTDLFEKETLQTAFNYFRDTEYDALYQ